MTITHAFIGTLYLLAFVILMGSLNVRNAMYAGIPLVLLWVVISIVYVDKEW